MSSKRNPGKKKHTDGSGKGKSIVNISSSDVDQLKQRASGINVTPADGKGWEVHEKKPKNKIKDSDSREWNSQNPTPKAWSQPNTLQKLRLGGQNYNASKVEEVDDESDDDESDEEIESDDFESDESPKSHETRKQHKFFVEMFKQLEGLTTEQISNERWHCPACKGGPGSTDWYHGLQTVIYHARTVKSQRVKLHRELAELLDEELRRMGTSAAPPGEIYGKCHGLEERDKEIVWPPMVVVMNTKLDKDDNDKWIGMGNEELVDYFRSFSALRARHSYGPYGHRGMSVLIFADSPVGYAEAERLSRHFEESGRDRLAWDRAKVVPFSGGKRQLYGYMAEKPDMELFNLHSQGRLAVKYEMRSYQEMVVQKMKQMGEDNQRLMRFKNKVTKEQKSKKALEETLGVMSEKLQETDKTIHAVRLQTRKYHEQTKDELAFQEQFFRDHIQQFYDARNDKEQNFEKMLQDQREKLTQTEADLSSVEENKRRAEDNETFIKLQDEELAEFRKERGQLMEAHELKKMDMNRRHVKELASLEEKFDEDFNKLLAKYTPSGAHQKDINNE